MICKDIIRQNLKGSAQKYDISVFESVTSTNTLLKEMAANGAPDGTVIIAESQTAGKGRMGRSFFSPAGTGIYISMLIRSDTDTEKAVFITVRAAVAVCMAIKKTTDKSPRIKWVNDVFLNDKKVCGILTESAAENGKIKYAVMGIGINVFEPDNGFPAEIKDTAGAICKNITPDLREKTAAEFLNYFSSLCDDDRVFEEYKSRSFVTGKSVEIVNTATGKTYSATVLDIDRKCRLVIEDGNGEIKTLSSGEIRIII